MFIWLKIWTSFKNFFFQSPHSIAPASIAPPVCTQYPADWSLKTRLLFTSPMSLSWAEQPKAQEEALGINQHCRAQYSSLPHSLPVGFFFLSLPNTNCSPGFPKIFVYLQSWLFTFRIPKLAQSFGVPSNRVWCTGNTPPSPGSLCSPESMQRGGWLGRTAHGHKIPHFSRVYWVNGEAVVINSWSLRILHLFRYLK